MDLRGATSSRRSPRRAISLYTGTGTAATLAHRTASTRFAATAADAGSSGEQPPKWSCPAIPPFRPLAGCSPSAPKADRRSLPRSVARIASWSCLCPLSATSCTINRLGARLGGWRSCSAASQGPHRNRHTWRERSPAGDSQHPRRDARLVADGGPHRVAAREGRRPDDQADVLTAPARPKRHRRPLRLTATRDAYFPVWSPDGRSIAYVRAPGLQSTNGSLWTMRAPDGGGQQLIATGVVANRISWQPRPRR